MLYFTPSNKTTMTTQQRINRLKELPTEANYPTTINKVAGFDQLENNEIKVLLNDDEFVIVSFSELLNFNENAWMYLKDAFYYRSEINEMLESFVAESDDLKIEREAV